MFPFPPPPPPLIQSGLPNSEAAKAFSGYDTNNDGKISPEDFLVSGKMQPKDTLASSSVAFIVVAATVVGVALVLVGYLYFRNKRQAQGFQPLSESRTNAIFDEEGADL